jgi:putative hydrolase of the HAD superfamily
MGSIHAVISDFGGVLTSPLEGPMGAVFEGAGVSLAELGHSLVALTERRDANPLFELESGRISEADFLQLLSADMAARTGRTVSLNGFGERFFAGLTVNTPFVDYLREVRGRGYALALCTNNVREWEVHWRAMVPVDELFDVVIDSSAVGMRKPEPRIYELTLETLGLPAAQTVFVDDLEVNCDAASSLGLQAVWFRDAEQAIADVETILRAAD